MKLFPDSFLTNTKFFYLKEISIKSQIIFTTVILILILSILIMPFIYVDTFTQSRGIIKTQQEVYQINSTTTGRVIDIRICENQFVNKEDTLILFDSSTLRTEINTKNRELTEIKEFIKDLSKLLSNNKTGRKLFTQLETKLIRQDHNSYLEK